MAPEDARRRTRTAGLCAVLALAGCATTEKNYIEPGQPVYEGRHGTAPAAARETLRVVTFNVEYGLRVPAAIAALRGQAALHDPDALLMQEMDAPGVEAVAAALALNYVYYPSSRSPKTHRDIGTAVLSPWPIEAVAKVQLPHLSRLSGHSRAVAAADVRIRDRAVRIYSLHLGTPINLSPQQRREQLDAVLADAALHEGVVIVGGDFNDRGMAERVASRGFAWPTREVGRTTAFFSFDHILARGLSPAGAPAAGVAREAKGVSDHYPVWATFGAVVN
jgi:endonuclease/exonuclease/phosphatase family metal-dependent hydrolase